MQHCFADNMVDRKLYVIVIVIVVIIHIFRLAAKLSTGVEQVELGLSHL